MYFWSDFRETDGAEGSYLTGSCPRGAMVVFLLEPDARLEREYSKVIL